MSTLTKEEMLEVVFNKPEWRMADFPFGDNKEVVLDAMASFAEQECIGFAEWMDKNEFFKLENGLWDSSAVYPTSPALNITTPQLYQLYLKSKIPN